MRKADPIARYLIIQCGIAVVLPIGWVLLAVGLDVARLGTLLSQSTSPSVALACMLATSVATFAPLIFMSAVSLLTE